MRDSELLKKDLFGEVRREFVAAEPRIVRDTTTASRWLRWLARRLLRREARALAALDGFGGVPRLIATDGLRLERRYIDGKPLHRARPDRPAYFHSAAKLLRGLHARDVVHNDLAKEPNLLVTPDGEPALIDFQLAWHSPRRGRLFRLLAYDDLRHLLKHKRTYCPAAMTIRERAILARPSLPSRIWTRTVKPLYLFVTRVLLGWSDREGASERSSQP